MNDNCFANRRPSTEPAPATLCVAERNAGTSFVLHDPHPADAEAVLLETVGYDGFGNRLDGCALQPYERDENALLLAHHRSYDPTPGQWLDEDPVAFRGRDTNLSRYVQTRPATERGPAPVSE